MSRALKFFVAYAAYENVLYWFREYYSMRCNPLYYQMDQYYKERDLLGTKEEYYEIYYDGKDISVSETKDILRKYEEKIAFFTHISPIASIGEFVKNYE